MNLQLCNLIWINKTKTNNKITRQKLKIYLQKVLLKPTKLTVE